MTVQDKIQPSTETSMTVRKIGNSMGVILPKGLLEGLGIKEGDKFSVVRSPDGFFLTPYDPEFERKMGKARDLMGRYRNTLRELAK